MPFDPSQPFEKVGGFNPSQPFEKVDEPSMLQSAGHAFVNNLPMGGNIAAGAESIPGVGTGKGYSENLEDWNKQTPIDKSAHPIAYGTGAVAGAVAPAFIAPETLAANPIVGNAVLGGLSAAGNTDLKKNPMEAAKEATLGAGIGGAVGAAGQLIGKGLSSLKPAASRIEANATAGMFDLNSRGINRLAEGLDNPETVMNHINDKVQKLFPDTFSMADTAASKFDKLLSAHKQASEAIGQVIDATSEKAGLLPEVDNAIKKLGAEAGNFNGLTSARNLEAQNELTDAAKVLTQLKEKGQLNFQNLYEVKKGIGQSFNNPRYDNPGVDKAYGIVSDTIDKILDRTHVNDPGIKEAFNHQKEIFKFTGDLLPAMKKGVSKEVAGVGGGLLSAGLGTAAVMGHPMALPAYAAKQVGKFAMPDLAQNLAYKGVNAVKNSSLGLPPQTPQAIVQAVRDYLESKYGEKNGSK